VITDGIREYMARDWAGWRARKDRYWADRIARLGAIEGFRIAEELRQQALMQVPGWPDAEQRQQDLQAHQRLADLLRRAGSSRRN
jgi:hypothetical protein